jgi:neurofibromin 1
VDLEKDPSTITFFPVSRVWQYNFETPVTVKVNTEYVQMISSRKQELIPGKLTLTNDVYHISELQGFSNAGSQANQLSFMSSADKTTIVLRTPKHNNLLHVKKKRNNNFEPFMQLTF